MLALAITTVVLAAVHADLTIFEHNSQQGRSTFMLHDGNLPEGWNDIASSVCATTSAWTLYEHYWYSGRHVNVRPGRCANVPSWFNDRASSAREFRDSLLIYEHYNFGGNSKIMTNKGGVPVGWNDIVSSVCASGKSWLLFEHYEYRGYSVSVSPGQCINVPGWFNDKMSSARLI